MTESLPPSGGEPITMIWIFLRFFLCPRQVGLDSQIPCYEIDPNEVDMNEATLIGEVIWVCLSRLE